MWCPFRKSSTHSDEICRTQKQQMGDNGSANCASQELDYPFVFTASDSTPRSNLKGQGILFAAVEVPTTHEPTKEQGFGLFGSIDEPVASFDTSGLFSGSFGLFGSIDEPVASFDTSGLFSGSGGANSEETEGSAFEIEEGPVRRLGLWSHIVDTLTTLARALETAVLLHHYVWTTFGSTLHNRVESTNTNEQPETFCGITTAEDRLVDNGVSGHSFDKCRFTCLSFKLENYQKLAIQRWITTAGGYQLKGGGRGLLRGHSIGTQELKRLTQLSLLAGPDVGREFFSVEQDGALSGGESLAGIPKGDKRREQPAPLGGASSARGVPQGGVL